MVDFSSASQIVGVFLCGIVAAVTGLVGVFAPRRKAGQSWRAALWTAAGLVGVAAVSAVAGYPSIAIPGLALGVVWGGFALMRTSWPTRLSHGVWSVVALPRLQAGALVLGGVGLVGWQIYALDRKLESDLLDTDSKLASMIDVADLEALADRKAYTDAGCAIPLWKLADGHLPVPAEAEKTFIKKIGLELQLIQTFTSDLRSNCHGWVFTGGRHWIRGVMVPQILKDNRYEEVSRPVPGDLAIFRDNLDKVTHTALVRAVREDGTVLLESKWGKMSGYVHTATGHAYVGQKFSYYRTTRGSHLLRGLTDGQPDGPLPAPGAPAVSTLR